MLFFNETVDTCTDPMETKIFTDMTKRNVIAEDPSRIIDIINAHSDRKLSRNNEYHFEVAQELLTLYIKMN